MFLSLSLKWSFFLLNINLQISMFCLYLSKKHNMKQKYKEKNLNNRCIKFLVLSSGNHHLRVLTLNCLLHMK